MCAGRSLILSSGQATAGRAQGFQPAQPFHLLRKVCSCADHDASSGGTAPSAHTLEWRLAAVHAVSWYDHSIPRLDFFLTCAWQNEIYQASRDCSGCRAWPGQRQAPRPCCGPCGAPARRRPRMPGSGRAARRACCSRGGTRWPPSALGTCCTPAPADAPCRLLSRKLRGGSKGHWCASLTSSSISSQRHIDTLRDQPGASVRRDRCWLHQGTA